MPPRCIPSQWLQILVFGLLITLLAGCGPKPRTVVQRPSEISAQRTTSRAQSYVVVRGDTLYQIAFRHGHDYRDIARWNGIGPPYTIYPGQRLRLTPPERVTSTLSRRPAAVPSQPAATQSSTPRPSTGTAPPPPRVPTPAQPAKPAPSSPVPTAPAPSAPGTAGAPAWRWPASGELIARFVAGDPTRQGIGIAGRAGDPVVAAADGQVVYSGAGLVGYGELVIIKHNDTWLSAYGHNRRRLVAEGDQVRAGQQIAELGRTGASRDMLHFEIRRSGKPVDPLGVLPAR